jgi:hypothetical protein
VSPLDCEETKQNQALLQECIGSRYRYVKTKRKITRTDQQSLVDDKQNIDKLITNSYEVRLGRRSTADGRVNLSETSADFVWRMRQESWRRLEDMDSSEASVRNTVYLPVNV